MAHPNLDHVLHTLMHAMNYTGKPSPDRRPTVTLSYDLGSQGDVIAARLAHTLNVQLLDRDLLHQLAERTGLDQALLERIENRVRPHWNEWLRALGGHQSANEARYFRQLVNVLFSFLEQGGVIIGRGAHLILAHHPVFRIRITASPEHCTQQLANERHITFAEAKQLVEQDQRRRTDFMRQYFQHAHHVPCHYDLMLNTDRLHDATGCVDIILLAMRTAGMLPPTAQ